MSPETVRAKLCRSFVRLFLSFIYMNVIGCLKNDKFGHKFGFADAHTQSEFLLKLGFKKKGRTRDDLIVFWSEVEEGLINELNEQLIAQTSLKTYRILQTYSNYIRLFIKQTYLK